MKVMFDVNVVLDALLGRKPGGVHAAILFNLVEDGNLIGYLCADSLTTLHYLVSKARDGDAAKEVVSILLSLFEIAPVNRAVLLQSTDAPMTDFEDAVVHQSAVAVGCDAIVTSNGKDFRKAILRIYSPRELIVALGAKKSIPRDTL